MALVSFSAKHARSWHTSSAGGRKLIATLFLGCRVDHGRSPNLVWH
jgi:hypothetical protein